MIEGTVPPGIVPSIMCWTCNLLPASTATPSSRARARARSRVPPRWLWPVALALGLAGGATACGHDDAPPGASGSSGETRATEGVASTEDTRGDRTDADSTAAGSTGSSSTGLDPTADDTTGDALCTEPAEATCAPSPGFVSTGQLEAFLGSELAVIDVRSDAAFAMEHVPGAVWIDPATLRATVDGIAGQVAAEPDAQAVFEAAGLTIDVPVVIYGANNGTEPARVLWTLAYYGHQGPLWMLDGGFDRWLAEARPTETRSPPPTPSTYATAIDELLRVDEAWVLGQLDDPMVTLVDARSRGEYGGGHIPGALSVDWTRNFGGDGLLLDAESLAALYGTPATDQTLVTYCQTGSRAAVDWLVLRWLGYQDVRLYDGSWAEWGADPGNPVEP